MDFKDAKERRDRGYSVRQAFESAAEELSEYDSVVIVAVRKDKGINIEYSGNYDLEIIGLLDVAKSSIIDTIG